MIRHYFTNRCGYSKFWEEEAHPNTAASEQYTVPSRHVYINFFTLILYETNASHTEKFQKSNEINFHAPKTTSFDRGLYSHFPLPTLTILEPPGIKKKEERRIEVHLCTSLITTMMLHISPIHLSQKFFNPMGKSFTELLILRRSAAKNITFRPFRSRDKKRNSAKAISR